MGRATFGLRLAGGLIDQPNIHQARLTPRSLLPSIHPYSAPVSLTQPYRECRIGHHAGGRR